MWLISVKRTGKAGSSSQAKTGCALLRRFLEGRVWADGREEHGLFSGFLSRTGRSIAQPGSPCDEDPALPVLITLISHF